MTAKFTPETQAAIDRAAEDAREARNSLDHLTLDLGATAEDWRAEAWQHRGKLLADVAKSLDIPLETLNAGRHAANHYSALQPGGPVTTPAEWFDSPHKPPANVTPETIAAASAPLASSAQSAWFALARKIDESEATYRHLSERCLKSWDYPSALRWRAIADGLNLARSHMEEIAAEVRRGAGLGCLPHTVGSATEPPGSRRHPDTVNT